MTKKNLEEEINLFLEDWDCRRMLAFLRDIIPLFQLYDVDEGDDWVKNAVGSDDEQNVRLIRTVYLVSQIAENHAGRLAFLSCRYPGIWKKMRKSGLQTQEEAYGQADTKNKIGDKKRAKGPDTSGEDG